MKDYLLKKKKIYAFILILIFIGGLLLLLFPSNYFAEAEEFKDNEIDNIEASETNNDMVCFTKVKGEEICIIGKNTHQKSLNDLNGIKFIPNANYFLLNPQHWDNNGSDNSVGTCTTVAAQMLIGYHNYYSDRRIIPKTYGSRQFLSDDYGNIKDHPIFSREMVEGQGCSSIGTQDGFYRELFDRTPFADWFFGQGVDLVTMGVNSFLDNFLPSDVRDEVEFVCEGYNKETAQQEIDNGKPIILGMSGLNSGSFHVVPVYGYASLDGEDGFLAHCGWGDRVVLAWYPYWYFGYQMRMSVNHQHNLIDTGERVEKSENDINGDTQKENYTILKCVECKYTTPDFLYETSGTTITKAKYNISGTCKIPDSFEAFNPDKGVFESTDINTIGELAFDGQTGIDNIIIPQKVKTIKAEAFKDTPLSIVYYEGTRGNLNGKSFNNFRGAKVFFYSAYKPTSGTNYWRYVSGYPQIWGSMRILNSQANGVSRSENTSQITLTFSENPGNLTKYNFKTTDCKVTGVSGSGVTRILDIENIKVGNRSSVHLVVTPANEKYFEDPTVQTTVYRMCANVNYCDFGRSFFSGQFDTLFPKDVIYGEDAVLPIPNKKGYEFDGWFKEKADGSFESISCVPLPYFSETPPDDLTVYAKWKRAEADFGNYDRSYLAVSYNTRGEDFNPRDMFFANTDTYLSDFSYALREVLVPALSRLSYNGYTYEYNIDLIDDIVISEDLLTATITLRDDMKFSDGVLIKAEDFKAYYEIIKGMYSVLPEPWSSISSVDVVNDSVFTINLTDRRDFAYILHEFRAVQKSWLDNFAESGEDPFEDITMIPVYGKYKIDRYEPNCRIDFTANEHYLWATDTRITDIDIHFFSDVSSNIMGFQAGDFDISFNIIAMDAVSYLEDCSESHQYDDRSRIFLGIGKESPLCRVYDEGQLQGLIKALGKTINYKKLNEVFINTICEKSGWYTDKMIKVEYNGSPWWADMEGNPLGREDVIMMLEGYGIYIDDLNFEIYVPDNDICRKIAEEIVADFEAVGIPASLNITQNKSEMKTSDLCLFLYDFTGGNVISDCILNMEDVDNQVFLFISEEDMATLESLKYEYKCADTNEEKKQIMLEVHNIMIQYVVKLNAILKMYLLSNELYEATGGDIWKLIY